MKKSDYIGWQEVFRFSLIQGMKEKAYISFLIISSVVLILFMPISTLITSMNKEEEVYHSEVTDFTIYDEAGLAIDYEKFRMDEAFRNIRINMTSEQTFDEHVKALEEKSKDKEGKKSRELIVHIAYEEGYFNLTFVKASNAALKSEDCKKLANAFIAFLDETRITAIEVTPEQLDFVNLPVDSNLEFIMKTGEIESERESTENLAWEEYMLLIAGVMVVTMMISLSGSNIAISVVTEKTTRVAELLMIHVRPMALLVGKILAILVKVSVQFLVMGMCYGISVLLTRTLFGASISDMTDISNGDTVVEVSTVMKLLSDTSLLDIVIAVVVVICGILFYSILEGLAGASVSKLEEINSGMLFCNTLMLVGVSLGMIMCTILLYSGGNIWFIHLCCLLPISAPFVVPTCILLGRIPLSIAIVSLIILLMVSCISFSFSAKVYEAIIIYNGNTLKLMDILQIAQKRKQTERKGANQHE